MAQTQVGEDDFRISHAGPDGSTLHDAAHDGLAYDSANDRYLVVWDADDRIPGVGATFNGKREVFGRLVSGDGQLLGDARLLATAGPASDERWDAENPEAVYLQASGEFFVIWVGTVSTGPVAAKKEVFGRRIAASGTPSGPPIRITQTGSDDNLQRDSREPALAYNAQRNEVLVVWQREESDLGSRVEHEIYAQRINPVTDALLGGPIRVSSMGPDGDSAYDAFDPDVFYAAERNEYLVAWRGDDDRGTLVQGEFEIFAQRLSSIGGQLGVDDLRVSNMGANGNPAFGAEDPAVAYNPIDDEWLVTWTGTDSMQVGEEVYGQFLQGSGAAIGGDFRISEMGPDGDASYQVDESLVVYNPTAREFFVLWIGEDDQSILGAGEFEVFGQRLTETGSRVGLGDARLSSLGPDGDSSFDPFSIGLELNQLRNEYFVVFSGDDDRGTQVDDEVEIFGQRVAPQTPSCIDGLDTICLSGGRFEVRVDWRANGASGTGRANRLSGDTGWFWFFDPANVELVVKVLDAQGINGHHWVFFGALSNVEYAVTVTDTESGAQRTYRNPQGVFASVGDTSAFPAGSPAGGSAGLSTNDFGNSRILTEEPQIASGAAGSCAASPTALCLNASRFRVEVDWTTFGGATGRGQTEPLTSDTGSFWFFDPANTELIVKVLDATAINGRYWVFFGALSNVQYTVRVTDTLTGMVRTYENPAGTFASIGDIEGFPSP